MFGAPSGGFGADGHQGFEPATVLPIVPPNGFALPAAMLSSRFFGCDRGCPTGSPGFMATHQRRIAKNRNPNYHYDYFEWRSKFRMQRSTELDLDRKSTRLNSSH